jgi:hypothetical protein
MLLLEKGKSIWFSMLLGRYFNFWKSIGIEKLNGSIVRSSRKIKNLVKLWIKQSKSSINYNSSIDALWKIVV